MASVVSATEARIHFGELLRRVAEQGEVITVERGGRPQAVVLSVREYERLRGRRDDRTEFWTRLNRLHERMRAELGDRELPPPEEVIEQMREERDAEIDAAVWGL